MANLKKNVVLSNILFLAAVPIAVAIVMEVLNILFTGTHLISSQVDLIALMRNLIISFCFALALNCNLALGRMDLSTGSQMYLACIVGGNLALNLAQSAGDFVESIMVLGFSIVIGAAAGMLVGLLFINLRILPMVLGLGVALVYESISFSVNDNQGLIMYGRGALLSKWWFIILIAAVVIIIMTFLLQYSMYGYNRRAIQGNQKLAKDVGINIYSNAVIGYVLAGVLVAVAGVFTTVYETRLTPVLGMSSNSYVFANMFPMAVGMWLARKSNPVVGVLIGALSVQILILGLSKFSIIGMSNYMQTCIRYTCWLLFMIYRMNEDKIRYMKARRQRIAVAKQCRAALAA